MGRQVIAHHYCQHLNEEVHQCVIFDKNEPNARLIGIEYIISDRLFQKLPDEEKVFWHSHNYEVKSGLLTAPGNLENSRKIILFDFTLFESILSMIIKRIRKFFKNSHHHFKLFLEFS